MDRLRPDAGVTFLRLIARKGFCTSPQIGVRPSKEDIDTMNKITQALKCVGVRVLDHIAVGRTCQDYVSFARGAMVER